MSIPPKTFVNRPKITLGSKEHRTITMTLEEAIMTRRSCRQFSDRPLEREKLASILFLSNGIQETCHYLEHPVYIRNSPSGGNLGSTDIYPIILNIKGVTSGSYYYNPLHHELVLLRAGDYRSELANEILYQPEFSRAAVLLVLVAAVDRMRAKYGDRGYRYVYLDSGHVAQNIYLVSTALSIGCCAICGFVDDRINDLVGVNGLGEATLYVLAVGEIAKIKGDNQKLHFDHPG
jgi:SagB-type dehydrogenase family enzyme